ncbi:MAG: hypothetical protein HRF46_04535 [Acidobacteriota bacterium]
MTLALAVVAAVVAHLVVRSASFWWLLGAMQPLLLVAAAGTRRLPPARAGWLGLGCGLLIDVLNGGAIGPAAIAVATAATIVAAVVARLELTGPLFWVASTLLLAALFETFLLAIVVTLGSTPSHALLGALAVVATTGVGGLTIAVVERLWRWWRSPERRRRHALRRR